MCQILSKRGSSLAFCLLLSLVLSGCAAVSAPPTNDDLDVVRSWISPQWPQATRDFRTTSGDIYVANLNASISSLDRLYRNNPSPRTGTALADKLYHRYKILGRFEDAVLALATIREVTLQHEVTADSLISLANIQAGFHLFTEALNALDLAKLAGTNPARIARLSAEINTALGNYDFSESTGADDRGIVTAAHRALLKGDFLLASTLLRDAEHAYTGTDPYVLAWIHLQQGIAFLRYGDARSANHFFKYAHERLPLYYLATEHLAETEFLLGNIDTAEQLYQQVSEQTQNPQFYALLAKLQASNGREESSRQSRAIAKAAFDKLLVEFPQAIGEHAVIYYLDQGQGEKALQIARNIVQNRQNIESWILLADTALAMADYEEACNAWRAATAPGLTPIELTRLTQRIAVRCN